MLDRLAPRSLDLSLPLLSALWLTSTFLPPVGRHEACDA